MNKLALLKQLKYARKELKARMLVNKFAKLSIHAFELDATFELLARYVKKDLAKKKLNPTK